jgi:hypothetical protein
MKKILHMTLCVFVLLSFYPPVIKAEIGVVNGLTHEKAVLPGDTISGLILLKNTGLEPEEVRLYQTDFFFTFDGKKFYNDPGKLDRSNSGWISYNPSRLTIAPQATREVKFTVRVPQDKSLLGTYWSIIMVENIPRIPPEREDRTEKDIQFGIQQVMRYGVQVVTHIADSGERNIKFINTDLVRQGEKTFLVVDVENTGERWLRPVLWLDLYDGQGQHAGKFKGDKWRIYPGTSVRYSVDISSVVKGKYTALIVIDNNDDYVFGAQYNLNLNHTN